MIMGKKIYPFAAIVGQEKMKLALILNLINPSIGGVLIRGEKGTAKSTAVRSLVDILPERMQVKDCECSCHPLDAEQACCDCLQKISNNEKLNVIKSKMRVIELPVSATEDRVVGTLDIEHAIKKGEKKFESGILAQANRNILYVDEVNLLDDHVVDILLDSAAMGVNTIEREGVSFSHPAKFTLIGTMNPEEGDLRPQLLDRFGLVIDVTGESETSQRVEVIKKRLEFEKDPKSFIKSYEYEQNEIADRIEKAKEILSNVVFDDSILETTAKISTDLGVDGHRADIVMLKTAMAIAAYNMRTEVLKEDLKEAASYVLPHRMRRRPFEDSKISIDMIVNKIEENIK
ncbi:ATP-binding protein [Romboutsia sp.]|uniref:ATP-binding protein n=1 Tax=Romboutsia sp. TaxID=1965302 RepID=UPI002BABC8C1|nr:AAA family ATPase [Romboutsia sp.]HSQ87973.1 AAA family ATPase [Romboutsia sp.]